jgi:hypothetical protein
VLFQTVSPGIPHLRLHNRHIVGDGGAVGIDLHRVGFLEIALAGVAKDQDALPVKAEVDDAVGGALVGVEFATLGGAVGLDLAGRAHVLVERRQLGAEDDGLRDAAVLAQGADYGGIG